jgi:hypothetical protein
LAHQDEKRKDRVPVGGDNVEEIPRKQINGRMKTVEVGKTCEPHQRHGKAKLDARGKKEQQNEEPY